ncbi:Crp/Fnr family transcriptional regulator [Phormidesmis priestleyi ULC007]|uniref:Crp/Fnr family transcriptional regulator n=1 Tax=Phormidesmis priestleyi ULC007 TaxID=1920490 RepID=A0A2T1D582_9CYAN|nr:Crp/Fnr family transcriptional regulator [Phormidesmis priestleyi]PSB15685.1 Crp/Fnr family transcriptional regulator [Phormidesmis priestleyi ULC007]PZO45965.1 MAG: Crp/Fnr family transcriptional regulator [Phormidesmis priestleyi]
MNFSEIDQLPTTLQGGATYQHLSTGQVLFHRNEEPRSLYAVKSGRIRLLNYTKSGQSISHYAVHAGEICAEVALFLDSYACSAVVEEPTQVLVFPKQAFLSTVQQNPDFAIAFMMQLSYRLHTTKLMVELRSIRSAQERVLHYLRLIIPPKKNTVVLQSLKHVAADLSISPEALSRTLARLESDGVITREKRRLTLLEPLL